MRLHQNKGFRPLRALPALLLALLLCACSAAPRTPDGPGLTLPVIGITDLDPDAVPSSEPADTDSTESTETPADSTAEPESTETGETAQTGETTEAAVSTEPESTEAPTEPETDPEPSKSSTEGWRVWIGDSRFVGIHDTVATDPGRDHFIAVWGAAYYWMVNTAVPALDLFASQHQVDAVYWSLGASDIAKEVSPSNYDSADKYSTALNDLIEKYPDTTFYILSYGPVGGDGKKPNDVPDADAYNLALSSFMDYVFTHTKASYIDQGEYIESIGYATTDGRHYDADTNKRIYDYILSQSEQ